MNVKEQYWKYSLVTIIVVLVTILFVKFIPFLVVILCACTIYILVRKQMLYDVDGLYRFVLSVYNCRRWLRKRRR